MNIEKILEMLGVEKLDESKQTEIKETLQTIIDAKAQELSEAKVEEALAGEKVKLVEEFETKFEDYKEDVTSKFSSFVDSILEEEMVIPEKVVKYARLGELYEDLIEQFKVRLAIDEGLLEEETKTMLKEAKEEINGLRDQFNEATGKNFELEKDAKEMANHIYLRQKCDGLTESQKKSVMGILEGADKEHVDSKFDIILESLNVEVSTETKVDEETQKAIDALSEDDKKKYDDMSDEEKAEYMKNMKKNDSTDTSTATNVNESTTEASKDVQTQANEGGTMMDVWKKMIRENRI
jgi:hypothetical protein